MKCRFIKKRLSAYLDGELPEEEGKRISDHLKFCPRCAAEVQELQGVWDLLGTWERVEPTPFLWEKVRKRVAEKPSPVPFWEGLIDRYVVPAAVTAVLIVGLVIGIHFGNRLYSTAFESRVLESPEVEFVNVLGLGTLDDIPEGSLGETLLALTQTNQQ
ncbi:zf-HC2 domain-containing protein [candidate division KSB1 bacterium]|nr:zf-HC2 domain-containing protein [candidate division KSB1 bacterium]